MQVHGIGGAAGVIWYALMAHKEFVTELYGTSSVRIMHKSWHGWGWQQPQGSICIPYHVQIQHALLEVVYS